MGELILCNQALAALPYYLEEASLNVYSLEELCYYMKHNLYLLESEFMNEELCTWLDKELGLTDTAERLRDICQKDGTLSEFVECILVESGYCSVAEKKQMIRTLQEMEHKSPYECGKIRADRFMENKKYINAIYEYRKLLQVKDEKNPLLAGNVWHNLGTAYARLYFFVEAAACFRKAYELNENSESMRECLFAYRCMKDQTGFDSAVSEFALDQETAAEIGSKIRQVSNMEEIHQFELNLDQLFLKGDEQGIHAQLDEWKDTYRKNCRI